MNNPQTSPQGPGMHRIRYSRHVEHLFFLLNQIFRQLYTRPKYGIIISVVFYMNILLHNSISFTIGRNMNRSSFDWADILCVLMGGNFEVTPPSTKMLIAYVTAIISGLVNLVFASTLFSKQRFINYSVRIVTNIIFLVSPLFMHFTINCFLKTYTLSPTRKYTISITLIVVLHFILLIRYVISSTASSVSPLRIIHPLVCKNQKQSLLLCIYVVANLHLSSYINKNNKLTTVLSLTFSISLALYIICYPIYTYRLQNFAFATILNYNAFGSTLLLVAPDYKIYGFFCIFPALFFSYFVYYFVYPYILYPQIKKNRFEIAYLLGNHHKVLKDLDNFSAKTVKQLGPNKLRNYLLAAVYYNHPKLVQIAKSFQAYNTTEWRDRFLLWSINEIISISEDKLPELEQKLLDEIYDSVAVQEKQLWMCAWLNYYIILPKITAKIGHAKAIYNSLIDLFTENYPTIRNFGHKKFDQCALSKKSKRTFFCFDCYVKLVVILFTFIHYLYLRVILNEANHVSNLVKIQHLADSVALYQIASWSNTARRIHVDHIISNFTEIEKLAEKFDGVKNFLNQNFNGINVRNSFNSLIHHFKTSEGNEAEIFTNLFYSLNNSLNNYHIYCFSDTNSKSLAMITQAVRINIIIFIVLFLFIVISNNLFRRHIVSSFDKLYSVPKDVCLKLGGFQPAYDNKYSIPYRPSVWDSLSYIATSLFFISFILILFLCSINAFANNYLVKQDIESQYQNIQAVVGILRTIIFTTEGVKTSINFAHYDQNNNRNYIEAFFEADNLFTELHHQSIYGAYANLIPMDFVQLIGRYILTSTNPVNISGFSHLIQTTITNMNDATLPLATWKRFYVSRFIIFIVNITSTVLLINISIWLTKPFVYFETFEIRSILDKVDDEIKEVQQRIQFSNVNQNQLIEDSELQMFVVCKDGTVVFQTSSVNLSIQNSYHIGDSSLPQENKEEILKYLEQYKNEYLPHPNHITDSQFIVNPHYDFIGQKLELSYILVVNSLSHLKERSFIKKKIDQLVVCSYLPFMKNLPSFNPKGRHTIVAIVRIPEFDSPDDIQLKKLSKVRASVTDKLCKLISTNSNYCRLREEGSLIIMTVNRDSDATPWNMHTLGADFMRKLRELIKKVGETLKFDMKPIVMLYKCHDTLLYVSNDRMSMAGYDCPFEYAALERISRCLKTSVNYTAEKTETRPQSVTKVRSCVSPRGENYDIFVIV